MAIQVFQEELPFSNKRTVASISTSGYTNPIIMPISLDLTTNSDGNIFETVFYLKNDDISKWYRNVVVSLVKDDGSGTDMQSKTFTYSNPSYSTAFGNKTSIETKLAYEDSSPATFTVSYQESTVPICTYLPFSSKSATLLHGSNLITINTTNILPGMYVSGASIIAGTKVLSVETGAITLTKKALASATENLTFYADSDSYIDVKFSYGYNPISLTEWNKEKAILIIPSIGTSGTPDTSYIPIRMRITFKQSPPAITIRDYSLDISFQSESTIA